MTYKAYETSSAQKRLYSINHLLGDSILYNEIRVWTIKGDLAPHRLGNAVKQLSQRHEALRTCFVMKDGEILQKVYDDVSVDFAYREVNSGELPAAGVESLIDRFLKPYDLGKAPLWKVELVRVGHLRQVLLLDFHHIIADGTAMDLIIKELTGLYQGKALPAPAIQYVDFATWHNDLFADKRMKKQEEYWLGVFRDQPPALELPTDYPRSWEAETKGSSIDFDMGAGLTAGVKQLATQQQTTLYVVLLAVFNVLLSKYANQEDIVVGTPISGRTHPEFQEIIGMFVNTLAMRNKPVPAKTFKVFLQEVSRDVFAVFENQDYPFEKLVEKLAPQRQLNHNPLFDVMFALQNYSRRIRVAAPGQDGEDLEITPFPHTSRVSKFDLTLQAFEVEQYMVFRLEYRTALFRADTIQRLTGNFIHILREVTGNPGLTLSEIGMISPAEREHLLYVFNNTTVDYPLDKTLHRLFAEQSERTPDHTALIGPTLGPGAQGAGAAPPAARQRKHISITYRLLEEKANRLAHLLQSKGVGPDRVVALMVNRSVEMIIGILGILKAGGAYLPIDTAYPGQRLLSVLEESGAAYLVTAASLTAGMAFTMLQTLGASEVTPVVTAARPPVKDFDHLPFPDRTLVNYHKYHQHIGIAMARHTVSLQATRGCPFNCAYCHKIWPKKQVRRTPEKIFAEIRQLHDAGVKRFVFIDDIFNLDLANSARLLEMLIKKCPGIQLFFPNGLRGDILTDGYIDMMVEAGTVNIDLALESASPRIQKLMGKNLQLEKFDENVRYIMRKHPGLLLEMELMIGFPTETAEEALSTLEYLKSLRWIHFPNLNILKIYPNTEMYRLARENGVSAEAIASSVNLAYHELPDTLPFAKSFARLFQSRFMNEYMLSKERLVHLLPHQVKTLSREELIRKYDSYFPQDIKAFDDILQLGGITAGELGDFRWSGDDWAAAGFAPEIGQSPSPPTVSETPDPHSLRILLLDLSQFFTHHQPGMLYDMVEEPLGLMYLLTYLRHRLGQKIQGKIAKSRIDFDSNEELHELIKGFRPDLIGIRTLSFYKEFFHRTAALIRSWAPGVPLIAGGPYASSDYCQLLRDPHVNLVVLGEGELTLAHLVEKMIANGNRFPTEQELRHIPGIAFINEKDKNMLTAKKREILFLDQLDSELARQPRQKPSDIARANHLLYIITTSGSTGKPKGVMLEHRNLANLLNFEFSTVGAAFNRVLQFASIGFDISFQEIFSTLLQGGELYLIHRETRHDIMELFDLIRDNSIEVLFLPPAFLKSIFEEEDDAELFPGCVRHIIAAGEQLIVPPRFAAYLTGNGVFLHNHYGPAETHVVTSLTMAPPDPKPGRPTIGKPIANTRILIMDEDLMLKPRGVVGEIYIQGANVGRGYLNNPELTHGRFLLFSRSDMSDWSDSTSRPYPAPGLYKTGDLGRWLPDGSIEFLGRKDHQVKIRGFRIEPGEIENRLKKIDFIKDAVVVDCETTGAEKYLAAYLVYESGTTGDFSELKKILSRSLPDYMIPSYFKSLDRIPLNSSGKVDRKMLRNRNTREEETRQRDQNSGPISQIELQLLEIWADVLKGEKGSFGIDDNFFRLGGHSLNGSILISKIHKKYHIRIPLAELFKTPTVRGLAGYISNTRERIHEELKPAAKKEYYPQSSTQKRLFFLAQLQNIGTSYNMPAIYKIGKNLDKPRMETAFRKLLQRHESLRTSFTLIDDQPVQRIHREVDFEVRYYEPGKNHRAETSRDRDEIDKIVNDFIRPFDLAAAPLLRVGFILLTGTESLLLVDMHHIITDGTSLEISLKDFMALYDGSDPGPLPLHYKDFTLWQDRPSVKMQLKSQEEYWLKTYGDNIPLLGMPTDYHRPEVQGFEGSHIDFQLPPETLTNLRQRAREEEATVYMVLLAVFNILLFKLSHQEDIVVGTPISARPHADLERVVGMFVNTLALRNFPKAGLGFNGFLRDLRDRTLEAFANRDYPFEDLVDRLDLGRDLSRNPLFDVMFALHNQYEPRFAFRGAAHFAGIEPYRWETHTANFDLELHGNEVGNNIYFILVYSTKLFKRETARGVVKFFRRILDTVLDDPHRDLASIDMVDEKEREEFSRWYSGMLLPAGNLETTVQRRRFEKASQETPGEIVSARQLQNEEKVAQVWARVLKLNRENIGPNSNFFDLGGHSLKAAILISRLHKTFNIKIPIEELFKLPTVRGIAGFLEKTAETKFDTIKPTPRRHYYALSPAQKRVYILQQLDTRATVYNMPLVIPLTADPGPKKLEETFKKLIRRHESLRTSFHLLAKEPVQKIHDEVEFEIQCYAPGREASGPPSPAGNPGPILENFIRAFDLSRAPLMRVGWLKTGAQTCLLLVDLHHIAADGISLQILAQEFRGLYRGEPLPPLRLQYKDYSEWQNSGPEQERVKQQQAYWSRQFSDELPVPGLPVDYPRQPLQRFEGEVVNFPIPPRQAAGLRAIASRQGATLYMVLLAVTGIFLYKLSSQEDIIVGTPVAGRRHGDLEHIIGMFVNTLALRNYPAGAKSFYQFLREVKNTTLAALANQDYPFEDLVEKLALRRDTGRNPLFDVMFTLHRSEPRETEPAPEQRHDNASRLMRQAKFDMTISAIRQDDHLELEIEYCTALYKAETLRRFIAYFKQILSFLVERQDTRLAEIEMIAEAEKRQLLIEFNQTAAAYPGDKTIPELFALQVEKTPNQAALVGQMGKEGAPRGRAHLTYKGLQEKILQVANALRKEGVPADAIVGLMSERSLEMIIGIFGILNAGAAYLPIDPEYPPERIDYLLKDSNAKLLVSTNNKEGEKVRRWEGQIYYLEELLRSSYPLTFLPSYLQNSSNPATGSRQPATSLAYIIYTSGTGGNPKGILTMHRNAVRVVKNTNYLDITPRDRILQLSNYAFDGSVFDIYGALLNGAALVMMKKQDLFSMEQLSQTLRKEAITVFFVTTALFNTLVDLDPACLSAVRKILFGGERVSVEHAGKALEYLGKNRVIHVYGPTETTVYATYYLIDQIAAGAETIPIGKPLANTTVYILDNNMYPVPIGIQGEIFIGGQGTARGYLNNPELTSEKFCLRRPGGRFLKKLPPWTPRKNFLLDPSPITKNLARRAPSLTLTTNTLYKTGDLAKWLPDGNIQFNGRRDQQVKIRGFRVEPGEIRAHLLKHDSVKETVVIYHQGKNSPPCLCAYIVPAANVAVLDTGKLKKELSQRLPGYMIPSYFLQVDRIPLTPNGKVDGNALPEPGPQGRADRYQAPRNEIERRLVEIWSGILTRETADGTLIGIDDSFFDLGGDSIKALQVSARLKQYGLELEMSDLFAHPVINELAKYVRRKERNIHQGTVAGEVPLTPIQHWFFEHFTIHHHFNHAVMLASDPGAGFDEEILEKVFTRILRHHDALRMVFCFENNRREKFSVIQENRGIEGKLFDLRVVDWKDAGAGVDLETQIPEEANRIQQSIDLQTGPLLKLGLFKTPGANHLLIVIHHLVVDGVSWRIILEDFNSGYRQLQQGKEIVFPGKTDSFRCWARKLTEYAAGKASSEVHLTPAERQYWREVELAAANLAPLPSDAETAWEKKRVKYTDNVSMNLEAAETRALLTKVNRAYNTEINDLLLTALGMAIKQWSGREKVLVNLEGHGREPIGAGIAIDRTVGWFTCQYPVILDMSRSEDLSYSIKSVKENLRRIPHKGIGYGISRYLSPVEEKKENQFGIEPEISFNYLGQWGKENEENSENPGDSFKMSRLSPGQGISPEMETLYLLDINGILIEGRLGFSFTYNRFEYKRSTIEKLADGYRSSLSAIIAHCGKKEEKESTPSDLGYAGISLDDLEDFEAKFNDID